MVWATGRGRAATLAGQRGLKRGFCTTDEHEWAQLGGGPSEAALKGGVEAIDLLAKPAQHGCLRLPEISVNDGLLGSFGSL